MKLRGSVDEAFDGLTAEEIRKIRGAAASMITPGLEGLARFATAKPRRAPAPPKHKRGRR